MKKLEEALIKLYSCKHDRFYSHLLFKIDRVNSKSCTTMGVGVVNKRLQMVYSPEFVNKLSEDCLITVLKHEVGHLVHNHISRGQGSKRKDKALHTLENVAMDRVLNERLNLDHIREIGGITPESFIEMLKETKPQEVLPYQNYEYYLDLLLKEKNERDKNGKGNKFIEDLEKMVMDDHEGFGTLDPIDQAILEEAIRQSAEKAKADNQGSLPSEFEDILSVDKNFKLPWHRELKNFIGFNTRIGNIKSRSKRNRRYGLKVPGKKKDYKAKILVALDTSGSMSGTRTDKVLSEIYGIWKEMNIDLDIVECDTEIKSVFTYDGKSEFKIDGRGGTELSPALDYAQENRYDGIIVLTDGEFVLSNPDKTQINSLWVIAENPHYISPIGRTVHLD